MDVSFFYGGSYGGIRPAGDRCGAAANNAASRTGGVAVRRRGPPRASAQGRFASPLGFATGTRVILDENGVSYGQNPCAVKPGGRSTLGKARQALIRAG